MIHNQHHRHHFSCEGDIRPSDCPKGTFFEARKPIWLYHGMMMGIILRQKGAFPPCRNLSYGWPIVIVVKIMKMTKQATKLFGCCPACVAYLEYAQPCVGQIQPNGVSLRVSEFTSLSCCCCYCCYYCCWWCCF